MEKSLKSLWVVAGQRIRLLPLAETQPQIQVSHLGQLSMSKPGSLGWKCHISCKPTSQCLVLPGRQKSGILTYSAKTVKGGVGMSNSGVCLFHLFGQSQVPCPPSLRYQGYLCPPVFSGLLWDASSAMTVAEGSPGQVEARFAFQALPTY